MHQESEESIFLPKIRSGDYFAARWRYLCFFLVRGADATVILINHSFLDWRKGRIGCSTE